MEAALTLMLLSSPQPHYLPRKQGAPVPQTWCVSRSQKEA